MPLRIWRRPGETFVVGDSVVFVDSIGPQRVSFQIVGPDDVPIQRLEIMSEDDLAELEPEVLAFLRQIQDGTLERWRDGR